MRPLRDLWTGADREWRTAALGVSAAAALLLGGLVIALADPSLVPGACQGLACLFTAIVLGYAGAILGVWVVAGALLALARRHTDPAPWRLWLVRVLAALSWVPVVGLVALAVT